MIVKVEKSYYDKVKHRNISAGEDIQVSSDRYKELEKAGVVKKVTQKQETKDA